MNNKHVAYKDKLLYLCSTVKQSHKTFRHNVSKSFTSVYHTRTNCCNNLISVRQILAAIVAYHTRFHISSSSDNESPC